MSGEFSGAILDVIEGIGSYAETAAPYVAGAGVAAGGASAAGAFGGGAATGTSSTAATAPVNSAASSTGPVTSAAPGGGAQAPTSSFFGNAVKSALVGGAVNTGVNMLVGGGRRGITVPPPPGAAMIDPEGAQAASQIRARQAISGGLNSTITPGANSQGAFDSATGGGKSLLGQ